MEKKSTTQIFQLGHGAPAFLKTLRTIGIGEVAPPGLQLLPHPPILLLSEFQMKARNF